MEILASAAVACALTTSAARSSSFAPAAAPRLSSEAPQTPLCAQQQQQQLDLGSGGSSSRRARGYGDGPIGTAIAAWERAVARAGGVTPHDLSQHVAMLERVHLPRLRERNRAALRNCTCANASECEQLRTAPPARELTGYGSGYDWAVLRDRRPRVSSLVLGAYSDSGWSAAMVCDAHARGTRVLLDSPSELGQWHHPVTGAGLFANVSYTTAWVADIIDVVQTHYADGFNIDMEDKFPRTYDSGVATRFSALLALVGATLHAARPGARAGAAVAWSPDAIDVRPYDYRGLAFGVDYLYVMAYSIQSQIFARCVACGNTYTQTAYGLQQFGALGIPMDRLVLGTSWGGNAWPCRNFDGANAASLRYCELPFVGGDGYRGVNCSDAVSSACGDLQTCWGLLAQSSTGRLWDDWVRLPYFNYVDPADNATLYQVWYEDAESLKHKYRLAREMNLSGIGPWSFGKLNYSDTVAADLIWDTFCEFVGCDDPPTRSSPAANASRR